MGGILKVMIKKRDKARKEGRRVTDFTVETGYMRMHLIPPVQHAPKSLHVYGTVMVRS